MGHSRYRLALIFVALCALIVPALASAHRERPSYWPDPRPDTSISPPAGGKVPKQRSLATALKASAVGDTRVVCQGARGSNVESSHCTDDPRADEEVLLPNRDLCSDHLLHGVRRRRLAGVAAQALGAQGAAVGEA